MNIPYNRDVEIRALVQQNRKLRGAIEDVLAEDPGTAHHEQAARWEWAREHLARALSGDSPLTDNQKGNEP